MKLFLDTANVEEIRKASRFGIISGVTTNPSLMAKEGADFTDTIKVIADIIDGPISAEVLSLTAGEMVEEGQRYAGWHPNVIIKVPFTEEGLAATKVLSSEGIKVNVTLIFSANQALFAALAGATYVSPFVGRLDDISEDGMIVIRESAEIFKQHQLPTHVLAASIRHPRHITDAAKAGAHVATVPYKVLIQAMKHPLTDIGLERFLADWKKARESRAISSKGKA
jgi:transaldolase